MTQAGLSYECFYCKEALAANEADAHECEPVEDYMDSLIDDYAEGALFGWEN